MSDQTGSGIEDILYQDTMEAEDWRDYILEQIMDTCSTLNESKLKPNDKFITVMHKDEFRQFVGQIAAGFYVESTPSRSEVSTPLQLANYIAGMKTREEYERDESSLDESFLDGYGLRSVAAA